LAFNSFSFVAEPKTNPPFISTGSKVNPAPLVTIAIPTFDRLAYLKEAVFSALAQTYGSIEVLIGDDGTSEALKDWAETQARQDARVRYQHNPMNLGLAGNWNALAHTARGEFLVIIGDDDRLLPEFVATLLEVIEPSVQVAFANHYLIDEQGARLDGLSKEWTHRYHRDELPSGEIFDAAKCVWQNSVPISAALLRTKDVQRLRFKEDLNTPEIEFFARLVEEGGRFAFLPAYLSEYRTHPGSATAGGLRAERLVGYLDAIPVNSQIEDYKRELMADLLLDAVSRCLQQSDRKRAQEFLSHPYYPRFRTAGSIPPEKGRPQLLRVGSTGRRQLVSNSQRFCAGLPSIIGCRLYRLLQRTKRALPVKISG
jgi:GT2 family glycosyltransferase